MTLRLPCSDCPRSCPERGALSFCGTSRPGRVHWRGVTVLEEPEISPTYEIYFTGCSLRCRFCSMHAAVDRPDEGEWLSPTALADDVLSDEQAPFRAIAFVGGDPSVNLPYLRALVPELKSRAPDVPLVFNTHLYVHVDRVDEIAGWVDWVLGDLHFWQEACARNVAATADYPGVARTVAEKFLRTGVNLILRVLVLPGHLECCARPSIAWAAELARRFPETARLHVMTHYAPFGAARTDPALGRMLTDDERERVRTWIPADVPTVRRGVPNLAPACGIDPAVPVEIDRAGRVHFPLVTGSVLPLVRALGQRSP